MPFLFMMTASMADSSEKPTYGIDAPGIIALLFGIAAGLGLLAWLVPTIPFGPVVWELRPMCYFTTPVLLAEGTLMLLYARFGKFHHRDRMLAMVPWKGTESVLDVGTGRGLLMIGAARRLTSGKAV